MSELELMEKRHGKQQQRYTSSVVPRDHNYIVDTDQGAMLRINRRYLQAMPGRQAQTDVATPTVLSNLEADVRAPMTIHPPLLPSETTYVEYIPEGALDDTETSTDDVLRWPSRVPKSVNRLMSGI